MNVDLAPDAAEIRGLLDDAVEMYLHSRARSPGEHPQVRRVELAFLIGYPEAPSLYVDLDARPDAEADGDATHRCIAQLKRPAWSAMLLPGKEPLHLTFPDGSVRETDSEGIDQALADFLVLVLEAAGKSGTFDRISDPGKLMLTVTYEGCPM